MKRTKTLGKRLTVMMKDGMNDDEIKEAIENLETQQKSIQEGKAKKWVVAFILAALIAIGSYYGVNLFYNIMKSNYDRTVFQEQLASNLGRFSISDAANGTDSMIISYAYDEQKPKFFSKYYATKNSYLYDIPYD